MVIFFIVSIIWITCGIISMYKFINIIEKLGHQVSRKFELFIFCVISGPIFLMGIFLAEHENNKKDKIL